jgi:hypothetical protein
VPNHVLRTTRLHSQFLGLSHCLSIYRNGSKELKIRFPTKRGDQFANRQAFDRHALANVPVPVAT